MENIVQQISALKLCVGRLCSQQLNKAEQDLNEEAKNICNQFSGQRLIQHLLADKDVQTELMRLEEIKEKGLFCFFLNP